VSFGFYLFLDASFACRVAEFPSYSTEDHSAIEIRVLFCMQNVGWALARPGRSEVHPTKSFAWVITFAPISRISGRGIYDAGRSQKTSTKTRDRDPAKCAHRSGSGNRHQKAVILFQLWPPTYSNPSRCFCTFPSAVRGNFSTTMNFRGTLNDASFARQRASSRCASMGCRTTI
jgi:hypothetical protein